MFLDCLVYIFVFISVCVYAYTFSLWFIASTELILKLGDF